VGCFFAPRFYLKKSDRTRASRLPEAAPTGGTRGLISSERDEPARSGLQSLGIKPTDLDVIRLPPFYSNVFRPVAIYVPQTYRSDSVSAIRRVGAKPTMLARTTDPLAHDHGKSTMPPNSLTRSKRFAGTTAPGTVESRKRRGGEGA